MTLASKLLVEIAAGPEWSTKKDDEFGTQGMRQVFGRAVQIGGGGGGRSWRCMESDKQSRVAL